tara:strand:- start:41 stop:1381 length:1341 start_codon:yes stop_codon:yes gene_type:complete
MKSFETDWLGSETIFYNTNSKKADKNINNLIDFKNSKICNDGLYYYLKYGYCVFGNTIFSNIKFLNPSSKIEIDSAKIKIIKIDDHWESFKKYSNPQDIFEKISSYLDSNLEKYDKNIVIPTSSGYDSRLMNVLCKKKDKIFSCSYGVSENQENSHEVMIARELSKKLNTRHEFIKLNNYFDFENEWYNLYGPNIHLNGHYHFEFFRNLLDKFKFLQSSILISGIFGDVWSGKRSYESIEGPKDINKLSLSHDISIPEKFIKIKNNNNLEEEYYESNRKFINNAKYYPLLTCRLKINLINFLLRIPKQFGFKVISPFLSKEIINLILNLNPEELKNRKWQREYFKNKKLLFNLDKKNMEILNVLDLSTIKKYGFKELDVKILSNFIDKEYLEEINLLLKSISYPKEPKNFLNKLTNLFSKNKNRNISRLYGSYVILKPLEYYLKKI